MKIVCMGDAETVAGFRLAGINEGYVLDPEGEDRDAILREFREITEDQEVAILIITEKMGELLKEEITEFDESKSRVNPIIVQIPDKGGPLEREDPLNVLINRTLGVSLE
jgi:vacuolar-type H+-ATPase subunit F/Vma7